MKRLLVLLPLCLLAAAAHATERHDWRVLKMDDGVYAFDIESVETDIGNGTKSATIVVGTPKGYTHAAYDVDCKTNRGSFAGDDSSDDEKKSDTLMLVEGGGKPTDPGWSPVPESGAMKIAADVACGRPIKGAIRVKSEEAALAKLKILSK